MPGLNLKMSKPWIALALVMTLASPVAAGTREGYDMWQQGDFFGAVREWRTAAIAGDPIAQFNLARAYQLGRGVPLDLKMAESWFAKAAAQGHQPSRDNYGLTLFQNGDREMAMPYITDAAKRGDPRAQYVLGTALFNGDTVRKDWPLAYAMMTRASAAGIGPASSSLAQMDKFIPADQRQKGMALARVLETAKPQLTDQMIADTAVAMAQQRPSVTSVQLPPSQIGTPPTPGAKPATQPVRPKIEKPTPVVVAKPVPALPAAKPVPVAAASGGWKVQLGAFGDATKARAAWSALQKTVGALGPYKASYQAAGSMTRLQAGPLPSRAAADTLCTTIKAKNPCFPVAP
ncbi:MAG: SPOR domain-containing protein [Sphingomonadales bacterium]